MYPINAASPQRVAIGAVVQISDGAVQTSGVSVKVLPQGTTASAGGGTIAYEEGIVHYTPTQAETNYTSFILIAYKTGCIPATVTVVTTASATAGHAGLDWGIVINKTTTNALTGTTIATTQKVDVETIKTQAVTCAAGVTVLASVGTAATSTAQTGDSFARLGAPAGASVSADVAAVKTQTAAIEVDTADIQSRLPAALVSGRIDASVGAMAANVLTATAIAADAITDAKVAADVTIASVTGAVGSVTGAVGSVTGNVGGNVVGSVGSVTGLTNSTIADQVWDEVLSGHLTAGTTGNALNAAGSAGDPWSTTLPGAYGAGTAGKIIGDNINATISSRASQTSVDTLDDYVDTEVSAIKAKTDNLPASPAAVGSAMTLSTAGYEAAADALLNRNVSGGSNTGRTVKQAYHFIRNKWVVAAGTLTVYDTDDTTSSWTAAVTGTAGADPVTGSDPA